MSADDRARWDARWGAADGPPGPPAGILPATGALPHQGRALDVAAGAGRNALWLARRGLEVTALDVSPVGLSRAARRAAAAGCALETRVVDLQDSPALGGPWDVILVVDYLQRELLPDLRAVLAPGGLLLLSVATVENLDRHRRPSRRFLLSPDELPALAGDLEVLRCDAAWRGEGPPETRRHEAWLVARQRVGPGRGMMPP